MNPRSRTGGNGNNSPLTMVDESSTKKAARIIPLLGAWILLLIIYTCNNGNGNQANRRRLSSPSSPSKRKYAYFFLTYDKTGSDLSHVIASYLRDNFKDTLKPQAEDKALVKCSQLLLEPSTVTIIEAPKFECHREQLKKLMMDSARNSHNEDTTGIKIIHLVNNPFTMAVSNYLSYTRETSSKTNVHLASNPCKLLEDHIRPGHDIVADLATEEVSQRMMQINLGGQLPTQRSIMTHDDFDRVVDDCYSLYQTGDKLAKATYMEHLQSLDPQEGVRLATTETFTSVAGMASDMYMLNRVQLQINKQLHGGNGASNQILLTLPMEHLLQSPSETMYQILNFVFFNDRSISDQKKQTLSTQYEQTFKQDYAQEYSVHYSRSSQKKQLMEYLQSDKIFGGPLGRIEALVNENVQLEKEEVGAVQGREDGTKNKSVEEDENSSRRLRALYLRASEHGLSPGRSLGDPKRVLGRM